MIKFLKPDFKYTSFVVRHKDQIGYKMAQYGFTSFWSTSRASTGGFPSSNGIRSRDGQYAFVFVAEKRRAKFERIPVSAHSKKTTATGHKVKHVVKKIRDGHWFVQVYRFPLDRLAYCIQHARTFNAVVW